MPITPEQSRAARAMLGWSQDDLESRTAVAKKTIADFERGALIPYKRNLGEIQSAFEAAGITFISENGGGAGLRLNEAVPRLARKRISRFEEQATMIVQYRGREFRASLSTHILDDLDRADHKTDQDFERSFARHFDLILARTARAIDAGRAGDTGNLILTVGDFPELG
jgi:transcriptional regulator with XRE-family HTH domain